MIRKVTCFLILVFVLLTSVSFAGSDLEIINYSLLDNALGDRHARITVKNVASGNRFIESGYFTASLTDSAGTRVKGLSGASGVVIRPSETQIVTIFFGRQQWPIASVEVE